MLRIGKVVKVDPAKTTAVVQFFDMDKELSYELPILNTRTGEDKTYWLPSIGEPVLCAFINKTDGFVIGSYYHESNSPPVKNKNKVHITFKDGTKIEYDKGSGQLTIENPKQVILKVQDQITKETKTLQIKASSGSSLDSPTFTISGDVVINGNLMVTGNISSIGQTTAQGGLKTSPGGQTIFVDDLVNKYNSHTHTDSSGGSTSTPDQILP